MFFSAGASVIQDHSLAQGLFFQVSSAYGGLKSSAFPPYLGALLALVSLFSHTKDTYAFGWLGVVSLWLFPFLPPLLQWALQILCCLPTAITFTLTGRQAVWKGTTLNFTGGHSYKDIAVLEDVHWYYQSVLRHSGNCRGT